MSNPSPKKFFPKQMYLADSEDEEELIVKFSDKKVTIDESKNQIYIFNDQEPPHKPKYVNPFRRK